MRLGLIARAEDRGLGLQSWEFARHLNPSVLLVDFGPREQFPVHHDRYPGALRIRFRGRLPEDVVKRWLTTVDVVYSAETFYDANFPKWCRRADVTPVVHVNPEFFRSPHPHTRHWAPTSWRLEHLPPDTPVVPVPVALDRWPEPVAPHHGPCRWLHVAGKAALADRNGTEAVLQAVAHLAQPCSLTVIAQDARVRLLDAPDHVTVNVVPAVENYWELYHEHDALVLPRRYGGLCLPVQEAMGAGLAVLMTDCPPNPQTWPVATVRAVEGDTERMPTGDVNVASIDPVALAAGMDRLADPIVRHEHQAEARQWADRHSWKTWADRYLELLSLSSSHSPATAATGDAR